MAGHAEVVELFLTRGVPVNHTMPDGATPLHISAQNGHHRVVQLLLKVEGINKNPEMNNTSTIW